MRYITGAQSPNDIERAQVRLFLDPPKPLTNPSINRINAENYIQGLHSEKFKTFARKLILQPGFFKRMPYQEFVDGLDDCLWQLRQELLKRSVSAAQSILLTETGHSHQWVASHAMQKMPFMPRRTVELHHSSLNAKHLQFDQVKKQDACSIFIFDDWSISGTQLFTLLMEIIKAYSTSSHQFKLSLFVTCVFMSEFARTEIQGLFQKIKTHKEFQHIHPILITSRTLETIDKLPFNREELQILSQLCSIDSESQERWAQTKVLTYADWKVPDGISMPGFLTNGLYPDAQIGNQSANTRFLPEITSPYQPSAAQL